MFFIVKIFVHFDCKMKCPKNCTILWVLEIFQIKIIPRYKRLCESNLGCRSRSTASSRDRTTCKINLHHAMLSMDCFVLFALSAVFQQHFNGDILCNDILCKQTYFSKNTKNSLVVQEPKQNKQVLYGIYTSCCHIDWTRSIHSTW